MQKNAKILSAGGTAPRPPCLPRQGALPPHPLLPAAGGFAPRPPKQPPNANFWLRPCSRFWCAMRESYLQVFELPFQILYLHLQQHTSARAAFQFLYISKTKARNQRKVKDDITLALSSTKPRIPKLALWLHSLPSH